MNKITAQVAVEAIANDPTAYDPDTIAAVREDATRAGVAAFYLDMLPPAPFTAAEGAPCYHPLSCRVCDREGAPCGGHRAGDLGHQSCTGRA